MGTQKPYSITRTSCCGQGLAVTYIEEWMHGYTMPERKRLELWSQAAAHKPGMWYR